MDGKAETLDFGALRRLDPFDRRFGGARGRPLDRCYIEDFLLANSGDIAGRVLEVGDAGYTRRFGLGRVTRSDVVDFVPTRTPRSSRIWRRETRSSARRSIA